jgi:4-hydroxy-3-polyprenylbenzoate decarboxylase
MLWNDLREFLEKLEEAGELKKVLGANWEDDIGGITELIIESRGPALLFDEIKGYPKGYRVASNLFNTSKRTAIAFGLPPDLSPQALAEKSEATMRGFRPVPPETVTSGPVLENVLKGDDIDLFKFPTPKWHENDGGRYIGTGVCVIQKDPDTGFVNSGAYRVSVHDRYTCAIFIEHGKHGDIIRRKYWDRGEKCPVIVSVGQEPVLTSLSGSRVHYAAEGVSEFEVAGFIHQSPYPVVRGEFTDLPIPAWGEIAIEGFIPSPQDSLVPEGPFGEWTGYYAHGRRPETIIEVKAIYHRNDPIIFGAPPTRPVGCEYFASLGGDNMRMYAEHVSDVIRLLVPGGEQYNGNQTWIVVDDDIDVSNSDEVLWALASRCVPEHGVKVIPGTAVWQLDPRVRPEDRSDPNKDEGRKHYTAHNLVINACRPFEWIKEFPPVCANSPEFRAEIKKRWKDLFV